MNREMDLEPLISHRFPLRDAAQALETRGSSAASIDESRDSARDDLGRKQAVNGKNDGPPSCTAKKILRLKEYPSLAWEKGEVAGG